MVNAVFSKFRINAAEIGIAEAMHLEADRNTTQAIFYELLAAELSNRKGRIAKTIEIIMRTPGYKPEDICDIFLFSLGFAPSVDRELWEEIGKLR